MNARGHSLSHFATQNDSSLLEGACAVRPYIVLKYYKVFRK